MIDYTPQRTRLLRDIADGRTVWLIRLPSEDFDRVMSDKPMSPGERQDIRDMDAAGLLGQGTSSVCVALTETGTVTLAAWNRSEAETRNAALHEQLQEDAEAEGECGITYDHDVPEGRSDCRRYGAELEDE